MAPAGLSLITTNFAEGPARNRALLVYAGIAAGGFSLGMVVGGLLTALGWRWVFFAPVLLAALILVGAFALVRDVDVPERISGGFDLPGALSVTGSMLLLVYGVVRLEHPSEGSALTVAVFGAGLLLLGLFGWNERRSANPLVRLGILRSGTLVRTNVIALLFVGSFAGFQFLATLYFQEMRGWSTVQTGLAMAVIGIDAVLAPVLTPRLVDRFGNARVVFGGVLLAVLAYALFLPTDLDRSYAAMFPAMLLLGVAFALVYGPLTIAGTEAIAEQDQGLASGLLYTAFQFGFALGISAVTAVQVAMGGSEIDALQTALIVPVAAAAIAAAVAAFGLRRTVAPDTSDQLVRA